MAVPKNKVSKARRNSRRANWKLTAPNMVECPKCTSLKCLIKFVRLAVITTARKSSRLRINSAYNDIPCGNFPHGFLVYRNFFLFLLENNAAI